MRSKYRDGVVPNALRNIVIKEVDRLAVAVERHPDRFAAFAHLPMKEPAAAADELERCVKHLGFRGASINGTTDGLFLHEPRFAPILSCAEALGCPLYIHPGPRPVQCGMLTMTDCRAISHHIYCPMQASAGMPKRPFTFCASSCPARSIGTRA